MAEAPRWPAAGSWRCSRTSAGGVGTHVRSLIAALRDAGARVGVSGAPATEALFGFRPPGRVRPGGHLGRPRPGGRRARGPAAARRARPAPTSCTPTACGPGLAAAARRAAGRSAAARADPAQRAAPGRRPAGRADAAGAGDDVRAADLVLAVSGDLAANARGRARATCGWLPSWRRPVPPAARTRAEVRAELGLGDGRPLVVAVGRLHPQKGYDVLLDALARWAARGPRCRWWRSPATARCTPSWRPACAPHGCRPCCSAAATTSPTCWARPTCACCPRAGRRSSLVAQEALRAGTPLVATARRRPARPARRRRGAGRPRGRRRAGGGAVADVLADPALARRLVAAGAARPRRAGRTRPTPPAGWSRSTASCWARRDRRRPAARPLAAVLVAARGAGLLGCTRRPPPRPATPRAARVLVVGVPGLTWEDVGAGHPEPVRPGAAAGAIGALLGPRRPAEHLPARRLAHPRRRQPARAAADPGPGPADPALRTAGCRSARAAPASPIRPRPSRRRRPTGRQPRFGSRPGALGRAVGCAAVAGRAAALAVAAPGVPLARRAALPADPAGLSALLDRVSAHRGLPRPAHRRRDTGRRRHGDRHRPALRRRGAGAIDAAVARLRAAIATLPGRPCCCSRGVRGRRRPPAAARRHRGRAGLPRRHWLTSASTGRAPYVQLIDVAPTALRALGRPVPDSMDGQALQPPAAAGLAQAIAQLTAARTWRACTTAATGVVFAGCWSSAAVLLGGVLAGGAARARRAPAAGGRCAAAMAPRRCRWPRTSPIWCRGSGPAADRGPCSRGARRRPARAVAAAPGRGAARRCGPRAAVSRSPG